LIRQIIADTFDVKNMSVYQVNKTPGLKQNTQ